MRKTGQILQRHLLLKRCRRISDIQDEFCCAERFYCRKQECPPRPGECPPCEDERSSKFPIIETEQTIEKVCNPCAYQMDTRRFCDDARSSKSCAEGEGATGPCKRPCPAKGLKSVNQCQQKSQPECPKGDWDCNTP